MPAVAEARGVAAEEAVGVEAEVEEAVEVEAEAVEAEAVEVEAVEAVGVEAEVEVEVAAAPLRESSRAWRAGDSYSGTGSRRRS